MSSSVVFSNYGTVPDWSPYKGRLVQEAITLHQRNVWHDNVYQGPWRTVAFETSEGFGRDVWQAELYRQDAGSRFSDSSAGLPC